MNSNKNTYVYKLFFFIFIISLIFILSFKEIKKNITLDKIENNDQLQQNIISKVKIKEKLTKISALPEPRVLQEPTKDVTNQYSKEKIENIFILTLNKYKNTLNLNPKIILEESTYKVYEDNIKGKTFLELNSKDKKLYFLIEVENKEIFKFKRSKESFSKWDNILTKKEEDRLIEKTQNTLKQDTIFSNITIPQKHIEEQYLLNNFYNPIVSEKDSFKYMFVDYNKNGGGRRYIIDVDSKNQIYELNSFIIPEDQNNPIQITYTEAKEKVKDVFNNPAIDTVKLKKVVPNYKYLKDYSNNKYKQLNFTRNIYVVHILGEKESIFIDATTGEVVGGQ